MAKLLRRWWIGVALAASLAAIPGAFCAPPPLFNAPGDVPAWIGQQAKEMLVANGKPDPDPALSKPENPDLAAAVRIETLAPLAKNPPIDYRQKMAAAASDEFGAILDDSKNSTSVQINSIIILANIGHRDTSPALQKNLTNKLASVRYWSAKGLAPIISSLKQFHLDRDVKSIEDDLVNARGKLGSILTESEPLVRGEMARVLGEIGDPASIAIIRTVMINSLAELKAGPINRAQLDAITALMESVRKLATGGKADPATLQAAADLMNYTSQRLRAYNDKSPVPPELLEGLRLEYKAYVDLVPALGGKAVAGMPGVPPAPADAIKLFDSVDKAIKATQDTFSLKPPAGTAPA